MHVGDSIAAPAERRRLRTSPSLRPTAPAYGYDSAGDERRGVLTLPAPRYRPVRVVDHARRTSGRRHPRPGPRLGPRPPPRRLLAERCARSTSRSATDAAAAPPSGPPTSRTDDVRRRPLGTSTRTARDSCEGDEGGPLLVPDGSSFALAGIVSWHRRLRRPRAAPGVYARLGDDPLNRWVHAPHAGGRLRLRATRRARQRAGDADFDLPPPRKGADYFTTFRWDLDNDGAFDDANGKRDRHDRSPTAGAGGRRASRRPSPAATRRRSTSHSTSARAPDGRYARPPTPVVPTVAPPAKTGPRSPRSSPPSARR